MLYRLTKQIEEVCPIDGVSGTQGNLRIDFKPEATPEERTAAQQVVSSFDWSEQAHQEWLENRLPERKTLRDAVASALQDNNAFLALGGGATGTQTINQVRKLTQQMNHVIRRLAQID